MSAVVRQACPGAATETLARASRNSVTSSASIAGRRAASGVGPSTRIAAAAIANRLLAIVDSLNIDYRSRQAAARREYTARFSADVLARQRVAEDAYDDFRRNNRNFDGSPTLETESARLRAEVTRLRTLRDQLETSIENARLSEVSRSSVIVRVDTAKPPEKSTGPLRGLWLAGIDLILLGLWWFWRTRQLIERRA